MSVLPPAGAVEYDPRGEPTPSALLSRLIAVAGAVVALAGGLLTGVLGLILVPLRIDTPIGLVRLPVAVVLVIVANLGLVWFARYTIQSRWGPLVPGAGWLLIAFTAASGSGADGSLLLLGDDWVGVLTIFGGTAAVAIGVVHALFRRPQPSPGR